MCQNMEWNLKQIKPLSNGNTFYADVFQWVHLEWLSCHISQHFLLLFKNPIRVVRFCRSIIWWINMNTGWFYIVFSEKNFLCPCHQSRTFLYLVNILCSYYLHRYLSIWYDHALMWSRMTIQLKTNIIY